MLTLYFISDSIIDMRLSIELKAKAIEIINVTRYRKNFISSIASFILSSFGMVVNS